MPSRSDPITPPDGGAQKEEKDLTVSHGPAVRGQGEAKASIRAIDGLMRTSQRINHQLLDTVSELVAAEEMREADRELEYMPVWVPDFLAAWGSKRPGGKRMTVKWAAELSGTTSDNVRQYRKTSATFRRLEEVARYGNGLFMQSYVDSGLRGIAPLAMRALTDLILMRNPQAVLKTIGWLRGPEELSVTLQREPEVTADDMAEAARRVADLEAELLGDPVRHGTCRDGSDDSLPGHDAGDVAAPGNDEGGHDS